MTVGKSLTLAKLARHQSFKFLLNRQVVIIQVIRAHLVSVHSLNQLLLKLSQKKSRYEVHLRLKQIYSKGHLSLPAHVNLKCAANSTVLLPLCTQHRHSACKACWGWDKMWLRTQRPMNGFPQVEGAICGTEFAESLGSMTRNLWATIFGPNAEKLQNMFFVHPLDQF